MRAIWFVTPGAFATAAVALFLTFARGAEPPAAKPSAQESESAAAAIDDASRVSVSVARDRAKTMLDLYTVTLDVLHHHYFHGDRAMVPARAMEDIFSDIERESKVQARWISVNMQAMSIDHEPKTAFEKKAAKEIAAGKSELETIEDGYYRRAGAIRLTGGCISCHGGFFKGPSKTPKFAGLIISVPIRNESEKRE